MPPNNQDNEFVTYVVDLMQSIGPVTSKRMFGGYGIFLESLMFALIKNDTLYLKTDGATEPDFKAMHLNKFTYTKQGKESSICYYQAPAEIMEDIEAMKVWSNNAYSAALRAPTKNRK